MRNAKIGVVCAGLLSCAGGAVAQPFVHNVGGLDDTAELFADIVELESPRLVGVGAAFVEEFSDRVGLVVIHDDNGQPQGAWLLDDPDATDDIAFAVRQDPSDGTLLILMEGRYSPEGNEDFLVLKFDPSAGAFVYEWRYLASSDLPFLGMELIGESGLVASSIRTGAAGSQATLLRYDQSTGLPIFFNRYDLFEGNALDAEFVDVTPDAETGDIYAVGSVLVDADGLTPGRKLLLARIDSSGNPVWFRAYDGLLSNSNARTLEGVSLEIGADGNITAIARVNDVVIGPTAAFVLTVDPMGNPVAGNYHRLLQREFVAADSTLELMPDGSMVSAGTFRGVDGGSPRGMLWTVDPGSAAPIWNWWPGDARTRGLTATVQREQGPVLGGDVVPRNSPPFGGVDDALLARTKFGGEGLCPNEEFFQVFTPKVAFVELFAEAIELPRPNQAGVEVIRFEPRFDRVCREELPCPEDIVPNGTIDLADLNALLSCIGQPAACNPNADVVPNGFIDLADLNAVLAAFGADCP